MWQPCRRVCLHIYATWRVHLVVLWRQTNPRKFRSYKSHLLAKVRRNIYPDLTSQMLTNGRIPLSEAALWHKHQTTRFNALPMKHTLFPIFRVRHLLVASPQIAKKCGQLGLINRICLRLSTQDLLASDARQQKLVRVPVVQHKAVAEVSQEETIEERLFVVKHGWPSESPHESKGGWRVGLSICLSTFLSFYLPI